MVPRLLYEGEDEEAMILKRLIMRGPALLGAALLAGAMGSAPPGDGPRPYVRHEVPAARMGAKPDAPPAQAGPDASPEPAPQPDAAPEAGRGAAPEAAQTRPAPPAAGLRVIAATEADPAAFLWKARPVVVFADTPADPAFAEQIRMLTADPGPLVGRDVVVITDSDPAAASAWRQMLRPEGFSLVLLDKNGQIMQRKPVPWSVREISRAIDKFPLRLQEMGRAALP